MIEDLLNYLNKIRVTLEEREIIGLPIDLIMVEVSEIAIQNWATRPNAVPDLTEKQLNKVYTRVIAKMYNLN
jgi:hypothetical protein